MTIKSLIYFLRKLNKQTVVKVNDKDIMLSYYETNDNKKVLNITLINDKLTNDNK